MIRRVAVAMAFACGVASASAQTGSETLESSLRVRVVTDRAFAHRELFTWTRLDQARALHDSAPLLTARGTDGEPGPYQRAIRRLADHPGPGGTIAQALLQNPELDRRRYAWPSPYATVVPRGARTYGRALIRIEIAEDGWFVRFDPSHPDEVRAIDGRGRNIPTSRLLSHPERIAVVFHTQADDPRGGFREMVVVQERYVATWSLDTDAIEARVQRERRILRRLARRFRGLGPHVPAAATWTGARLDSLAGLYRATLAFDSRRHRPTPENLALAERSLARFRRTGPPLVRRRGDARAGE